MSNNPSSWFPGLGVLFGEFLKFRVPFSQASSLDSLAWMRRNTNGRYLDAWMINTEDQSKFLVIELLNYIDDCKDPDLKDAIMAVCRCYHEIKTALATDNAFSTLLHHPELPPSSRRPSQNSPPRRYHHSSWCHYCSILTLQFAGHLHAKANRLESYCRHVEFLAVNTANQAGGELSLASQYARHAFENTGVPPKYPRATPSLSNQQDGVDSPFGTEPRSHTEV